MAKLYILGPAEIRNSKGELEHSFLAGPKRLALLTYLLLNRPRGFHRRDSLLPLFWPEQNQKSARNALSNMLYHIRKTLGKDAIENRGMEEVTINTNSFWCDALAFEQAVEDRDHENALKAYRSDLLKGFHVQDTSPEFDHWLEQERKRFNSIATDENWALAEKLFYSGDYETAKSYAKNATELNPFSESLQLRLINFLDRAGDPQAALNAYSAYARLIHKEFEEEPGPELSNLVKQIKIYGISAPKPSAKKASVEKQESQPYIAILPFETLGSEKASAFTDAIHADILTRLSQVSDIFVISRTSVQSFRSTKRLLPDIARELKVGWILTGEVQEIGKNVKVSVRLVKAVEDRQVWAEIYQRRLTADELFNIQAEITQKISESLEMQLTRKERTAIRQIPTEDLEAFRLHAYGRWSLDQRTEKGMNLAEDYFRQALSRDPGYAQAWMGLADALTLLHDYGHEKDKGKLPEAEKAARRALKLDPEMAEAYASLGLHHTTRRKADSAIRDLKKAIELRPGYADAHSWLCWVLQLTGKRREGLESAKKAVKLNPLSQESIGNLALGWLVNREYTLSVQEARRLLQIQPDFTTAKFIEGLGLYHLEKHEEAARILKGLSLPWAGNGPAVTRMLSCLRSGDHAEAEKLLTTLKDDVFGLGLLQATEGKYELALQTINSIEDWNYWEMLSIHHFYPDLLKPIRNDERFGQIMQKVNASWGLEKNWHLEIDEKEKINGKVQKTKNRPKPGNFINNSIAVLPFKDLDSQEPRFTNGIHGDILTSLSRIKDLQVISRSSVSHYNGTQKGAKEIGEELNVSWLLAGEVKQTTEEIDIRVRLIKASTDALIWSQVYARKLTAENLFLVQEDITGDVLETLKVHFPRKEKQQVRQKPTTNLNAYRLYIQGRNCLDQRTESAIYQGLDCLQGSIETDPDYALAWAGLADALSLLNFYGLSVPKGSPDPMEAAKRSVALNPGLGEGHASLGIVHSIRQEAPAALRELKLAVHYTPNYAEALVWLGWINLILGRPKKALEPAKQGVRLNPLAPAFRVFLSEINLANGKLEEALLEARRAREINPDYALAHYIEGLVLYHSGKLKEAVSAFQKTLSIVPVRGTPGQAEVKTSLAFTFFALGEPEFGRELKNQIFGRIDPFPLAMLQVLYGEMDKAFETFSRVQNWSSFATEKIRYFFPEVLAPLRKDKRYKGLIMQLNEAWGLAEVESSS